MSDINRFKDVMRRASKDCDGEDFIHNWWEQLLDPEEGIESFEDMTWLAIRLAEAHGVIDDENSIQNPE